MTEPTAPLSAAVPPPPAAAPEVTSQHGGRIAVLVVASVVAGLLLVGAGFGLGRLTAPSERTAVCLNAPRANAPQGGAGGQLPRPCRVRPGSGGGFGQVPGGQPGQVRPRPFGPGNGNGNGNGPGNGPGSRPTPTATPTAAPTT